MTSQAEHTRYEELLNRAVDGLLTDEERRELDGHLETCESCRRELADFDDIKKVTDMLTERILRDAEIESPREARTIRRVMNWAFALVFAGLLVLLSFGVYVLATDPEVPPIVKVGTGLAGLGTLILAVYVIRVRWRGLGRDPYREIDL